MDNWTESESETMNQTLCNANAESVSSSTNESFHEEPSTQDISIVRLDTSQESLSPQKFTTLPIPREKSGKERKTEYTEILKKIKKCTPNSERKRNHGGKDLNSCSAKKRKISETTPQIESIISKTKQKSGLTDSDATEQETKRKPMKLPKIVKMPEVVLPKIFGKKPKEKMETAKTAEKAKWTERYSKTISPIELTRSNRAITANDKNSQTATKSGSNKANTKLKFDKEFLELQKQFELDERTREQYM